MRCKELLKYFATIIWWWFLMSNRTLGENASGPIVNFMDYLTSELNASNIRENLR